MLRFSVTIIIGLLAVGCSPSSNPKRPNIEYSHRELYQGEIMEAVQKNYASPSFSNCDRRFKDRVIEIAKTLDEKHKEIQASQAKTDLTYNGKKVPSVMIGDYRFFDLELAPKKKGWFEERYGWQMLFDAMEKKNLNLSDIEVLTDIDGFVRQIIMDENMRLQWGILPKRSRTNGKPLQDLVEKIGACRSMNCTELNLTPHEESLLNSSYYHRTRLAQFRKTPDADLIAEIYDVLSQEVDKYVFKPNRSIRQIRPNTYLLKMKPGKFAGAEQNFGLFTKYWESGKNKIILETSETITNLFEFVIHKTIGMRAFVDFQEKTLNIAPDTFLKTIAHELGHVIGFRDAYFTSYDFEKCEYVVESNETDIMSDGLRGKVQTHHWRKLSEMYN